MWDYRWPGLLSLSLRPKTSERERWGKWKAKMCNLSDTNEVIKRKIPLNQYTCTPVRSKKYNFFGLLKKRLFYIFSDFFLLCFSPQPPPQILSLSLLLPPHSQTFYHSIIFFLFCSRFKWSFFFRPKKIKKFQLSICVVVRQAGKWRRRWVSRDNKAMNSILFGRWWYNWKISHYFVASLLSRGECTLWIRWWKESGVLWKWKKSIMKLQVIVLWLFLCSPAIFLIGNLLTFTLSEKKINLILSTTLLWYTPPQVCCDHVIGEWTFLLMQ